MIPLNTNDIYKYYDESLKDAPIYLYEEVDSTNTRLIKLSSEADLPSFTLCTSESQSQGKGRLGRQFQSPKGTGIYMSILVDKGIADFDLLTIQAAVAAAESIEELTGLSPKIKWVNDLYLGDKKIAGILTQGILREGALAQAVVGIGINVSTPSDTFLPELQSKAGSLNLEINRNELIGKIVTRFKQILTTCSASDVLADYKSRCFVLGETVSFEKDGTQWRGRAVDIDEQGHLLVQTSSGLMTLSSGEISIRGNWSRD